MRVEDAFYVKFWQSCTNKCSFCNQRLGAIENDFGDFLTPTKSSLILHTDILTSAINESSAEYKVAQCMGGELFHINDVALYGGFEYFSEAILKYANASCQIIIFSNLLYEDLSLFLYFASLLNKHSEFNKNIFFNTSFDFVGRFSSNSQVDLFCKNIKFLYDYGITFHVKTTTTLDTLKNFSKDLYTYKKFEEIKNFFDNWALSKFKLATIDDENSIKRFSISNIAPQYINTWNEIQSIVLTADTKIKTKLWHKEKFRDRSYYMIINGSVHKMHHKDVK